MKEYNYAMMIYLHKYIPRFTKILWKWENVITLVMQSLLEYLHDLQGHKTAMRLPTQSIIWAFQSCLYLSFQNQQFMAVLTKWSAGSTCMAFEVCYAVKLYFWVVIRDPFLACHVVMVSLSRLSTLCNPCIICHFLQNANMHTPTANTNPLYISRIIYLALSTCATMINVHAMFYDVLYNFSKEDTLDKVSCFLV